SLLNLVVRVVDRFRSVVEFADPAAYAQFPAGFDAGDPALAEPDQHHRVGAVVQFGADAAGARLAAGLHAAQGPDHGDFLAPAAVARPLRPRVLRLVGEFR